MHLLDDQCSIVHVCGQESACADGVRHGPGPVEIRGPVRDGRPGPPIASIEIAEDADAAHGIQRLAIDGAFDFPGEVSFGHFSRSFGRRLFGSGGLCN